MRRLLKDAENYVDDISGNTMDWPEHMTILRDVFERIRRAGLTLRPWKCAIGSNKVEFVEHKISKGEVQMDTSKLA